MNAIVEELQAANPDVRAELFRRDDGRFQIVVSRWTTAKKERAWIPLPTAIQLAESEERARTLALEILAGYRESHGATAE